MLAASRDLYGISEPATAKALLQRFGLEGAVRARLGEFGVDDLWEAFVALQRRIYARMLADVEAIRRAQLPHSIAVLDEVRQDGFRVALATMSYRDQTRAVLDVLGLTGVFEVIVTEDDVQHGKPDPEIYRLVAHLLGVPAAQCLVIEDTLAGVQSALAAGMWCIAVPTYLTREQVHTARVLDGRWIVDDPADLIAVVQYMLAQREMDETGDHRSG